MLAGLRHDPVIGRDHQHRVVDPARPGHHRVHEALVTRHVDESQYLAAWERRVRVAELDRYAARLFLLEAIRIDAGERAHHAGLAVVDVSRGTDDHRSNDFRSRSAAIAADCYWRDDNPHR